MMALFVLAYFVFGLLEVVLMWLPDDVVAGLPGGGDGGDYPGGLLIHRSHFMVIGLVAWAAVPPILVQLRRPWRRVAPMLQAVVVAIAGAVVFGLAGTFTAWVSEDLIVTIPILVLAALHPRMRDFFRRPTFDRDLVVLAAVAAVPWAVYAFANARLQFLDAAGDPHAGIEHWATAALLGVVMIACALLGASDHDGWRLPAWTAGLASILFGAHSLVFPGSASGLSTIWAIAAVAWGVVFLVTVVRRGRAGAPAVGS